MLTASVAMIPDMRVTAAATLEKCSTTLADSGLCGLGCAHPHRHIRDKKTP
jgi:hypothetical protein